MSDAARVLERAWRREDLAGELLHWLLRPAAVAWGLAARARVDLYRRGVWASVRLPVPVVSVGNLAVGGSGKTPTALWLAGELEKRGYRPALLSRGYGGSHAGPLAVDATGASPAGDWRVVGDEPVLLAKRSRLPVIVARDRAQGGELAHAELGADVLVLDDGFQHLQLARDFDLVLARAGTLARPATLPAGPLREAPSALMRADALVVTEGEEGSTDAGAERWMRGRPIFHARLRPVCLVTPSPHGWEELPLALLAERRAVAVSGIADAQPFYNLLWEWDLRVEDTLDFPDHHPYSLEDWKRIANVSRDRDLVVTTEKDLVKLDRFPFARQKLVAVRVEMEVDDGDRLIDAIERAIGGPGERAAGRGER
ncbi:MAG: tetraacyldisaccharide 4-kinase [Candidatus Binatota bacterium]|jgi:tetraacyldisaccharide 4'-kinase|nr:tetraacyldisaccharide 4-kinase [Candidatus Binatota bacterium]